jgi:hypothetical protein
VAKSHRFKSNTGGHVRIWVNLDAPKMIDVPASGTYTTEDKDEIDALKAADQVSEVKIPKN